MNNLIADLNRAIEKAIDVPNSLLPVEFHSQRGYRSLSAIKRIAKIKDEVESKHKKEKREKAARILSYSVSVSKGEEITYLIDEDKLYAKQLTFCNVAVKMGLLDSDDFDME